MCTCPGACKCPYCDFNSHAAPERAFRNAYPDALRSDLEQALPGIWGRQVVSVFIGGGTPSLLSAAGLDELLAMLRACLNLWPDAEITMEANPGTAEASRFRDYAASGVTRFRWASRASMTSSSEAGPHPRRRPGPRRDRDGAARRVARQPGSDVRLAGPDAGGLYGRSAPGAGLRHRASVALSPDDGAEHGVRQVPPEDLPDDDTSAAMQDLVETELATAGLARYEV